MGASEALGGVCRVADGAALDAAHARALDEGVPVHAGVAFAVEATLAAVVAVGVLTGGTGSFGSEVGSKGALRAGGGGAGARDAVVGEAGAAGVAGEPPPGEAGEARRGGSEAGFAGGGALDDVSAGSESKPVSGGVACLC